MDWKTVLPYLKNISKTIEPQPFEYGCNIVHDSFGYALGPLIQGGRYQITLPEQENIIGTFHSHPYDETIPRDLFTWNDVKSAIQQKEQIMCLGYMGEVLYVEIFKLPKRIKGLFSNPSLHRVKLVDYFNRQLKLA